MPLHSLGGFTAQKLARSVWAGVRAESVLRPSALTSLRSSAYFLLVMSFGPPEPYFNGSEIANGVTSFSHAFGSPTCVAGSGRHAPSAELGVNRNAPNRPSCARAASMAAAAASPTAIPPALAAP